MGRMKQREGEDAVPRLWNANYTKVFVANFMIFFSFMLLTPLLPIYLSETFGADKHTIGTVLFGYSVLALIARMFSGYIVDSFSRKRVLLVCFFFFSLFFVGYIAAGSLLLFAIVRTLHGAPFGATTVANSTMAIDVLSSERRTEGIGYYGLANNIASAISPSVAIWIFHATHDFNILFWLAMLIALGGMLIVATVKVPAKPVVKDKPPISLDRFFLVKGTGEALTMACFSFSYGVVSTYVAIYGREQLGVEGGAGTFFLLLSLGLILSRLQGSRALRQGRLVHNAAVGVSVSLMGYMLFAALHNEFGYYAAALVIGLGNGHMYLAYQNMFVNLAPHSQRGTASSSILVAWDVGLGIGVLLGGLLSEKWGYSIAFWAAWLVNLVGFLGFWLYVKAHFNRNKLR
jgi:predicted MFS family arabinose efflux permease